MKSSKSIIVKEYADPEIKVNNKGPISSKKDKMNKSMLNKINKIIIPMKNKEEEVHPMFKHLK